jgi:hypothetical protein
MPGEGTYLSTGDTELQEIGVVSCDLGVDLLGIFSEDVGYVSGVDRSVDELLVSAFK